ncbi:hypothetical protein [Flavihumibacter fluvii]|uniref:hypothetical protein n=1 Tax=Flavihumibacter fluvii TaxID=2838157 RepID=UPI001BDDD5E5|nr:hypothetical protein [Flavihumibacter fluvii]
MDERNLSAYLVAAGGSQDYIYLNAGTIKYGVQQAILNHSLSGDAGAFLHQDIKSYLISHAHLDHISGLILNSPNDRTKKYLCFNAGYRHFTITLFYLEKLGRLL